MNAPHRTWAVTWTLWFSAVLFALAMPDRPIVGLWVLLAFLPLEAGGVFFGRPNTRDTLSENVTWLSVAMSKHRIAYRGWNLAIVTFVIVPIMYLLARTTHHYSGSLFLAVVFLVGGSLWLKDHLLDPWRHG